jgi:hypothetical protein
MRDLDKMPLRDLQVLSAKALSAMVTSNNNIWQFNQQAHNDSHNWYKAVIRWYIEKYNGWPDETGPGAEVKLIMEKNNGIQ